MFWEIVVTIIGLNFLSWVGYVVICRNVNYVVKRHVYLIGEEDQQLVLTKRLGAIKFGYRFAVILLAIFSGSILYLYTQ